MSRDILSLLSPLVASLRLAAKRQADRRAVALIDGTFTPLTEYADGPVGFCRDILGVELTPIQVAIAESLRDNPRVSVAACYASGKTFLAACLLLWWLYTRTPALVVTTAPTERQVKDLLWRYVRRLHRKAKRKLPGKLLTKRLEIDEEQMAFGFAGSSGHSVQGIHEARNVLFMEDEAAGMRTDLLEDFEGITASADSRHLKIGNPTSDSGPFYDSHENPKVSKEWVPFSISAEDTPNVIAGETVVPGLVEKSWVERIRATYGEDSPFWTAKVLGKFVKASGQKVVPPEWRDLARQRWEDLPRVEGGQRILGCDIGRSIDPSVFVLLDGRHAEVAGRISTADLTIIADEIERLAVELDVHRVNIDATGLGIGVCDIIRRRRNDGTSRIPASVSVNYCVLGSSANEKQDFALIIDEVHWAMRRAFAPDNPEAIAINPDDIELCDQVCWRGWMLTNSQKFKVWTKREVLKEYGESCDFSDGLMLCFWDEGEAFVL